MLLSFAASGCYAEGHSRFLSDGPAEHYLSLGRCVTQATTRHADGTPKYAGFVCKEKVLWFTLEEREYDDGELTSQAK